MLQSAILIPRNKSRSRIGKPEENPSPPVQVSTRDVVMRCVGFDVSSRSLKYHKNGLDSKQNEYVSLGLEKHLIPLGGVVGNEGRLRSRRIEVVLIIKRIQTQ